MKKKKPNWFIRLLTILFFIYISLYIALESGYYETKVATKATLTEDSIKQFEQDIKDGKPIDVNNYTYDEKKDFSNNTTDVAIFLSERIEKFMANGITDFFDVIKALFT